MIEDREKFTVQQKCELLQAFSIHHQKDFNADFNAIILDIDNSAIIQDDSTMNLIKDFCKDTAILLDQNKMIIGKCCCAYSQGTCIIIGSEPSYKIAHYIQKPISNGKFDTFVIVDSRFTEQLHQIPSMLEFRIECDLTTNQADMESITKNKTNSRYDIIIRDAIESDFVWISNTMQEALCPFYGGDHRAHAKRIFDAHINGGEDHVGFFSFEQKMFLATQNDNICGMVHIVGKRQATYKISPLIVAHRFRGVAGVGSLLLDHIESYIRSKSSRQIYCTVADSNDLAMSFFIRKGFIKAGTSHSHYKNGITETMLYKPLYNSSAYAEMDDKHISVAPLDALDHKYRDEVSSLLMKELPKSFDGINQKWMDALFNGYDRRKTGDISQKYKLIYVATDNHQKVVGVAAATPKKGSPIKIMPLIAKDKSSFEALLIDIPYQLAPLGHKLYIHLKPSVDEVISLQRLGWILNAALPAAYSDDMVTQQWSLDLNESLVRRIRLKKKFFDFVCCGQKDLEIRVGYDSIKSIKKNDKIKFVTYNGEKDVVIKDIRTYTSFDEMLKHELYSRIVPSINDEKELIHLLKDIYPEKKETLGVFVFEFKLA